MQTYRLTLCYDGTRYRGWQRLPDTNMTVQGKVEETLSEIFGQPIQISGSGRTDAGVHATGQVASFQGSKMDCSRLLEQLRKKLPEDIGALSLTYAAGRFHARLCATEKTYVYRLWNAAEPDVFQRKYRLQFPQELNFTAMEQAAVLLCGTHDFLGFCSNKHFKKSSVRTLSRLAIEKEGNEVRFVMTADGFLYNMARIMIGTLLEIGIGKRDITTIPYIFESRVREAAGGTAPAKGLCLVEVNYQ